MTIISLNNLCVMRENTEAVRGVSLSMAAGEMLAVIGPSGSGKSSLLLAIAGLIPSRGRTLAPSRIGVVFQDHGVYPWLTVAQNVSFGLAAFSEEERAARVLSVLATCGLTDLSHRYPAQLSGGQRQRVAVARTLAVHADLVLLDEPFASLDVVTRLGLRKWLRDIARSLSIAMIIVTHDIDDAVAIADRVLVLKDGKTVLEIGAGDDGVKTKIVDAMLAPDNADPERASS